MKITHLAPESGQKKFDSRLVSTNKNKYAASSLLFKVCGFLFFGGYKKDILGGVIARAG